MVINVIGVTDMQMMLDSLISWLNILKMLLYRYEQKICAWIFTMRYDISFSYTTTNRSLLTILGISNVIVIWR